MWWFNQRRKEREKRKHAAVERESTIEIIAHQKASRQAIEEVKRANKELNRLLEGNGFTVKIFLAAGGKAPKAVRHGD